MSKWPEAAVMGSGSEEDRMIWMGYRASWVGDCKVSFTFCVADRVDRKLGQWGDAVPV